MKKKYPKEWYRVVDEIVMSCYTVGYNDAHPAYPLPDEPRENAKEDVILSKLDAAEMLKAVPEPIEIEWCRTHNFPLFFGPPKLERLRGSKCCFRIAMMETWSLINICEFVKLREVEE